MPRSAALIEEDDEQRQLPLQQSFLLVISSIIEARCSQQEHLAQQGLSPTAFSSSRSDL